MAVALVDALRDTELALLLGAVALVQVAALLSSVRGRSAVALRPDLTGWLAGWLHRQSAATGEPVERLADRCVAALDSPGDVKGRPYSEGAFPGVGQLSTVTVTDDGGDMVRVKLAGPTWDGRELVSFTTRLPASTR